jgi:hypothetical protein
MYNKNRLVYTFEDNNERCMLIKSAPNTITIHKRNNHHHHHRRRHHHHHHHLKLSLYDDNKQKEEGE